MKLSTIIKFSLALFWAVSVNAEDLKPQPFFGLMTNNNESGDVVVQRVLPGATADALGLRVGDVIVSINQEAISDFQQIINLVNQTEVGAALKVQLKRDGQPVALQGVMKGKAREKHGDYEVVYDVVKYKNNRLRSIVYRPLGMKPGEKRPAMYYIQGYTCQSIDHAMVPQVTLQQLLDAVVKSGMVVYKMEKLGVGDSEGPLRCEDVDFTTEMAGFEAGLKALKSHDFVDPSKVFIFGHSLGGVYAPLLAEKHALAGVAAYGAVFKPWYDYMLDIFAVQSVMMGTSQATADANVGTIQPLLSAWLQSDRSWSEVLADPKMKTGLDSQLLPIQGEQILHRNYRFFRDLNRYDLQTAWKSSRQPVLVIHGEFDIQAINADWAHDVVAATKPNLGTVKIIKNTDHGLMRYPTMEALQADMAAGRYSPANPGEHYNVEVAEVLINWMEKLIKEG